MYTSQGTLDREDAVERYGPMVRRVAHQMVAKLPPNVDVDDLIQAGMIGLFDAMTRYDAAGGAQFETFAMQRVRGAMLDELRGADWMPRSVRKAQRTIEQAMRRAEQRSMRLPTEAEIAAELGIDIAAYHQMLGDARGSQLLYIDDLGDRSSDDSFLERHDATDHDEAGKPSSMLHDNRFREALTAAIEHLPEREQLVMSMYYEKDLNLKEIGAVLGVTESRISQIHSQAVARIRAHLKDWI